MKHLYTLPLIAPLLRQSPSLTYSQVNPITLTP